MNFYLLCRVYLYLKQSFFDTGYTLALLSLISMKLEISVLFYTIIKYDLYIEVLFISQYMLEICKL